MAGRTLDNWGTLAEEQSLEQKAILDRVTHPRSPGGRNIVGEEVDLVVGQYQCVHYCVVTVALILRMVNQLWKRGPEAGFNPPMLRQVRRYQQLHRPAGLMRLLVLVAKRKPLPAETEEAFVARKRA
jgi:hypothetical protein